jgi:uncharacterized protein YkwD
MKRKGFLMTAMVAVLMTSAVFGAELTTEEQKCFDAVNQMRTKVGLEPFEFCPALTEASRSWSESPQDE